MTTNLAGRTDYRIGTWKLDPAHSELSFTVRHLAISKVRGTFRTFDVTVVTPEDPSKITVEATIDMASVTTGQEQRDGHLLSGDFFLIEEHPTMTFVSTSITAEGDEFTLTGDLTLRGVTKPVTLAGEFAGIIDAPYGQVKAGATATTKINRHDFGVSWNSPLETGGFMLADDVNITIELQLVLQAEEASA